MKFISDFSREDGWFLGNACLGGPLQVAHRQGVFSPSPPHLHPLGYEYFVVLEGNAELTVGDRTLRLQRGNIVVVEPGEPHSLQRQSADFSLLILMDKYIDGDKQIFANEEASCTNV